MNYELEEHNKDDLTKKMKEVHISDNVSQDKIGNLTLEKLIT